MDRGLAVAHLVGPFTQNVAFGRFARAQRRRGSRGSSMIPAAGRKGSYSCQTASLRSSCFAGFSWNVAATEYSKITDLAAAAKDPTAPQVLLWAPRPSQGVGMTASF